MTLARRFSYWFPTLLWAAVIFSFSSQRTIATSEIYWQDFVIKKSAHLFVYCVLAILVFRSLKHTTSLDNWSLIMITVSMTALYALSDEFHQSFTPGREPRFRDVVIDATGIAAGIYLILARKLPLKI